MDHDADPLDRLIDDLARKAAEDYLRQQAQQRRAETDERTKRATLPDRRDAA